VVLIESALLLAELPTKPLSPNYAFVVTLTGVALGLQMLAKGIIPDSGGRERPFSRGRLRLQPALPKCPNYYYYYYYCYYYHYHY